MKKPLFLSLVMLLFYTPVFFAQPTVSPQVVKVQAPTEKPKITLETYETALKHYVAWSENQAKKSLYKEVSFSKTVDGKEIKSKFTDLTPLEQSLFLIHQGESLSNHLYKLDVAWKLELQKLRVREAAGVKPAVDGKEESIIGDMLKAKPKAKDVERYLAKLLVLRKANAVRFEALLKSVFKEYNKEIPAADQKSYLQKVTTWHDKYKLIERPKK